MNRFVREKFSKAIKKNKIMKLTGKWMEPEKKQKTLSIR